MKFPKPVMFLALLAGLLVNLLAAQQASGDPGIAPPAPSPAGFLGPQAALNGDWEVKLAIQELFGTMKEVTGGLYFTRIRFNKEGNGSLNRNAPTDETFEFDLKDNQLTLAWGSRLNPKVDLYRVLFLSDGTLYMRSTKLSNATGGITYILKRKG